MKRDLENELESETRGTPSDLVGSFLVPIWRSKHWILLFVLLGLGAGAFVAAIRPNSYESVGKLLVRTGTREQASTESSIMTEERGQMTNPRDFIANEIHLLSNPSLFESVARKIGPHRILAPYDPNQSIGELDPLARALHEFQSFWFDVPSTMPPPSAEAPPIVPGQLELAAKALMKILVVSAEPTSSVLTITCATSSPQLSADLVNAFIDEALITHQAVFSSESSLAFLDQQVDKARSTLAQAEEMLSDYKVHCGFFDLETDRENLMTELQTLEQQISASNARLAGLDAVKAYIEGELALEKPERKVAMERQPITNPQHTRIKDRLFDLHVEVTGLDKLLDRTPAMRELERTSLLKQIEKAEQDLAGTPEFLNLDPAYVDEPNPRHEQLRQDLDEKMSELVSLRSEAAKQSERLDHVKSALIDLERCGPLLGVLAGEATVRKERLDQFTAARSQVGVLDLLDEGKLINLRPLQRGFVASEKSGPRRGRMLLIGAVAGLISALGFALMRANFGAGLRSPADIRRSLGVPVLGLVPETNTKRHRRPRIRQQAEVGS